MPRGKPAKKALVQEPANQLLGNNIAKEQTLAELLSSQVPAELFTMLIDQQQRGRSRPHKPYGRKR